MRFRLAPLPLLCSALLPALSTAADNPLRTPPPKTWIDPDSGHRVTRVTDEPGSGSLYFNVNSFTPDGRSMVYTSGGAIRVIDLATWKTRPLVPAPARVIEVGHKTATVYFTRASADRSTSMLFAADIATGDVRKIADLPRRASVSTINADETLAAGTFEENDPNSAAARATPPPPPMAAVSEKEVANRANVLSAAASKVEMMDRRLAERRPMTMFTLDLRTGTTKPILEHRTDWLNHLQFSPTDPTLLLYCHEGTWWKVDRIWTIRADGSENRLVHKRVMGLEAAGHEFWSPDGKTIWYEIRFPWGVDHFAAGFNVETGERIWYHVETSAWSIHYQQTRDGKLFCGDGGSGSVVEWATPENEWIFLYRPERLNDAGSLGENLIRPGLWHPERLVNLHKNTYTNEPNAFFTPDQKHVIFRSNMLGPTYVFAVEVEKAR